MFEIYGFSRNLTLQYSLTKQWNTICVQHLGGLDISWTDKDFFFKRVWWQSSTNNFIVLDFLTRSCAEIFVFDYLKKKKKKGAKTCKYYISIGNIIILQTTPAHNFWATLVAPLHRSPYFLVQGERILELILSRWI